MSVAVADDESTTAFGRVLRLQAFQILLVLALIVAVFVTLAPNNFGNLENSRRSPRTSRSWRCSASA